MKARGQEPTRQEPGRSHAGTVDAGADEFTACEFNTLCENGTLTMAAPVTTEFRRSGTQSFPFAQDWRLRFAAAYRRQLQAWVKSIENQLHVGASAWDGLVATAVAEAGVRALETGT